MHTDHAVRWPTSCTHAGRNVTWCRWRINPHADDGSEIHDKHTDARVAPPFSYIPEKLQGSAGSQKTSQPQFVREADKYNIAIRLTSAAVTVTTLVGHSRNRAVEVTVTTVKVIVTATITTTVTATITATITVVTRVTTVTVTIHIRSGSAWQLQSQSQSQSPSQPRSPSHSPSPRVTLASNM